jgi:hypothetical protein
MERTPHVSFSDTAYELTAAITPCTYILNVYVLNRLKIISDLMFLWCFSGLSPQETCCDTTATFQILSISLYTSHPTTDVCSGILRSSENKPHTKKIQIRSCLSSGSRKARGDKQLRLRGFCRIQLLTNVECSINAACRLYFLVFRFRRRKKKISRKEKLLLTT